MNVAVGVAIIAAHLAALVTVAAWAGRNTKVQNIGAWAVLGCLAVAGLLAWMDAGRAH